MQSQPTSYPPTPVAELLPDSPSSSAKQKCKGVDLIKEVLSMKGKWMPTIAIITGVLAVVGGGAISAQDKYTVKVPNGLSFSEFRGYEAWQVVSISQDGPL